MPQLADEFTPVPRRGSPAAPIQAIPSGTGSSGELPEWVRQRLEEQRRAEAAAAERERRAAQQAPAEARARAAEEAQERAQAEAAAGERVAAQARAARERASTAGPPPRGTPAEEAYLKEMLNATPQGIAPGYGSFSKPGEPAKRLGPKEPTLAEKLRDGFAPGSGRRADGGGRDPRQPRSPSISDLSEEEKRLLRNMEREPPSGLGARMFVGETLEAPPAPPTGPGARMFALTADEEAMWAAISPDEYISEEAIAAWRQDARIPRTERQNSVLEALLPDADRRAAEIALAEAAGRQDEAAALRAGDPLEGSESFELPPVGDFARWGAWQVRGALEQQNRTRERFFDEGRDVLDATIDGGQTALRAVGSELGEIDELGAHEVRERVHQALLGQVTGRGVDSILAEAIVNRAMPNFSDTGPSRALQGLLGNETYSGDDHPFVGAFPEGSAVRDIGDPLLEWVTDPFVLRDAGFGAWTGAKAGGPWGAVGGAAGGLGWALLDEISSEDSELAEALEEHIVDPTEESLRRLNEFIWRGLDQRNWVPRYTP